MPLQATPTGLSVISTYAGLSLRISWYPVTQYPVTGYIVYRSEIPYGDFTRVLGNSTTIPGLTLYDTPPTPNDNFVNQWWYRVSSWDGTVESVLSGPATYMNYAAFDTKPLPGLSWSSLF